MILMNVQIQLHNSLVMYVSVIQLYYLYAVNFIVILQMVIKILQIYRGRTLI